MSRLLPPLSGLLLLSSVAQANETPAFSGPKANGPPEAWRSSESRLGPEVHMGSVLTVSSSTAHDTNRVLDMGYGLGGFYQVRPEYGFGARYEMVGLGSGESQRDANSIDVRYSAHALWAMARVLPYSRAGHAVFLNARLGLSFMHLTARGTRPTGSDEPVGEPFLCSATAAPNLAFGSGLGYQAAINHNLNFLAMLDVSMLRGSSSMLAACAPGLGSPVTVGTSLGFSYLWDV